MTLPEERPDSLYHAEGQRRGRVVLVMVGGPRGEQESEERDAGERDRELEGGVLGHEGLDERKEPEGIHGWFAGLHAASRCACTYSKLQMAISP